MTLFLHKAQAKCLGNDLIGRAINAFVSGYNLRNLTEY